MIKEKLTKIFTKLFDIKPDKTENSSMDNTTKWDSFSHVNLIIKIEEQFKIKKIDPSDIAKLTSFKKCVNYITKKIK